MYDLVYEMKVSIINNYGLNTRTAFSPNANTSYLSDIFLHTSCLGLF